MANDPLEGFHEVNLASPTSPDLLGVCDPGTQEQTTSPSVIYRPHPSTLCAAPLQANALDLSDLPTQPVYSSPRHFNCAEVSNISAHAPDPASSVPSAVASGLTKLTSRKDSCMKLLLGKDFPASPPKGYFLTKIFHPNVGPNGEICVNVLKRDWTAELGIRHVLLTIKCLLIHPNPESALNEEAGRLLLENYEEYAARARLLTEIHGGACSTSSGRAEATQDLASGASASSADPMIPGVLGGAEGPMAKKHAEREFLQGATITEASAGNDDIFGLSTDSLSRLRSPSVLEVREKGYERLKEELAKAQRELKLKDEECERLSKVRDQLGQELEELTASLLH